VRIPIGDLSIAGDLVLPKAAVGLVIFAHGSGSSRFSGRNRAVAAQLNESGLATLLLDLLTEDEEVVDQVTRQHRFDIPLLAARVAAGVRWVGRRPELAALPIGIFGASTGAAAALIAAAGLPERIAAVVSRGGRPDLAREQLSVVAAPTLLVVGGRDTDVIGLNEEAAGLMRCPVEIAIVPGATHLFEEPGALGQVARLACDWFLAHLTVAGPRPGEHLSQQ